MICWKISIFAQAYTSILLWLLLRLSVVICWKISIFAQAYTSRMIRTSTRGQLWFAEKLVSLHKHIHPFVAWFYADRVVICWKISIFAQAYTSNIRLGMYKSRLWFAEKLVSLHKHIHLISSNMLTFNGLQRNLEKKKCCKEKRDSVQQGGISLFRIVLTVGLGH